MFRDFIKLVFAISTYYHMLWGMVKGVLTSISGGFMRNPICTCNLNILPILKSEASNTDHWMPLTPLMLDLTP